MTSASNAACIIVGAEAGEFFEDLRQLSAVGEQGIDFGVDTVGG